jgi:hypothetical protein
VVTFATATLLEVLAYLIPWLDNLLDSIATPAAVVAGVLISVSTMVGLPPLVRWTVALIAGGGVAGAVQGMTVLARAKSSTFTGGAGNHMIAIGEVIGSIVASMAAIVFPVFALVLVLIGLFVIYRISRRIRLRRDNIGHAG